MTRTEKFAYASLLPLALAAGMIFFYAPTDTVQGPVQRIFYTHVSSAICAYVSFALVVAGSAGYLWKENLAADRLARAAAPVGLLFTTVTIGMGIIWAKPIWGWDPTHTWDARFTSTVVLGLIYGGYILVRRLAEPGRQAARFAAVVGIAGFIDVPIVHFSVSWWRTLHPGPVLSAAGGPALPPAMLITFLVTLVALLLFAGALIALRYQIEALLEQRPRAVPARVPEPAR